MLMDKNVAMTTRDGVTLRADVYRPDGPGRFPVLLSRLPYDKNLRRRPGDIDVFVEHGYVVIMQDTRGRFASDGDEYCPLVWEAQDGYDAVEWAAGLPYSDGQVGTMGQSYLGATQYLLAPTRPPHLKASFPASAPADFHQCWVYHSGGAFELGWQIPYAILMARDTIARRGLTATLLPELERELAAAPTPWAPPLSPEAYGRLPLLDWAKRLEPVAPYLGDYLRHPEDGPPWWQVNLERQHEQITVPMYHVTSWYDIFLHGGLANFCGLRERAMTAEARAAQKLLIGPWAHLFPYTSPTSTGTGEIDFGAEALDDVLVYTSAVMTESLEVTGPVTVTLYAASNASDTDFTAKLVDVRPDGYAQNLADGIVRARYRESRTSPAPLVPGEVARFTVDLWATSHVFLPGHRIRLEIASSNFPRFDRNLNTGEDQATGTHRQSARQTVFHDERYPSHVVLPVIPR